MTFYYICDILISVKRKKKREKETKREKKNSQIVYLTFYHSCGIIKVKKRKELIKMKKYRVIVGGKWLDYLNIGSAIAEFKNFVAAKIKMLDINEENKKNLRETIQNYLNDFKEGNKDNISFYDIYICSLD